MPVELRPHQQAAVEKLNNGKILFGGTGTGKTITSLAYFVSKVCGGSYEEETDLDHPRDLYIITTAKKRDNLDWEKEAKYFGIGKEKDYSRSGVKLTVDSWNNISKYSQVEDAFFIFDEQRLVGAGTWAKAFIELSKKNQWILLSATPGDTWLDYIPVFIANGFYKNRTEFKRRHVVYNTFSKFPKVDRYIEVGTLVKYRNSILVHMPYEMHTTRIEKTIDVDYNEELTEKVSKKRWHVYEERPLRGVAELLSVMRKIANSDSSRLAVITDLIVKHPRLIVFYNFDYELEILRGLSKKTTVAEWNGHCHDPIPETDAWVYLVQYAAGAEGWNCISTDAICFYSLSYSYKHFHQAKGRIDRLNTPYTNLYYYNLLSKSPIDQAVEKALSSKKAFNEADFRLQMEKTYGSSWSSVA